MITDRQYQVHSEVTKLLPVIIIFISHYQCV